MSIMVNRGQLRIKSHEFVIFFGKYEISMETFVTIAKYLMTNTDLVKNDPRLGFVDWIKGLRKKRGWNSPINKARRRLAGRGE